MHELPIGEPPAMPRAPRLALEAQVAAQQEGLDPDAIPPHVLAGGVPRPDEVAQGLVQCVRHPDVGQLAGAT